MLKAVVDRLEGKKAVLLVGEAEKTVNFPVALLPKGIQEGCYLKISIEYDEISTEQAKQEAAALLAELKQQN